MGQRASDTRGITFEDVEVPAEVSLASACLVCVLLGAGPAVDLLMKGHPYREHAVSFNPLAFVFFGARILLVFLQL